jgi:hypothetical protein
LWPSGVFYSYLLHFSRFGTLWQEKSGNLAVNSGRYLSKRCAVARVSATVPTYISEIEKKFSSTLLARVARYYAYLNTKMCQLGYILAGLGMANLQRFVFKVLWCILRPYGIQILKPFCIFFPFWYLHMLCQEKFGDPGHNVNAMQHNHKCSLNARIPFRRASVECWVGSLGFRVTRLGEFSPSGRLFTLDSFVKITVVAPIMYCAPF